MRGGELRMGMMDKEQKMGTDEEWWKGNGDEKMGCT